MKITTIDLPKSKTDKIIKRVKIQNEKFTKQIFSSNHSLLSITLRSHIAIENQMNNILKYNSMCSHYAIKRNFSQKNEILRFSGFINESTFEKIKCLNDIRNKFAHNLNYKPGLAEIRLLSGNHVKNKRNDKKLIGAIGYLAGYLSFVEQISEHHPFAYTLMQKWDVYKRDRLFKYMEKEIKMNLKKIEFKGWKY